MLKITHGNCAEISLDGQEAVTVLEQYKCLHGRTDGKGAMFRALYVRHVEAPVRVHLWRIKLAETHAGVEQRLDALTYQDL